MRGAFMWRMGCGFLFFVIMIGAFFALVAWVIGAVTSGTHSPTLGRAVALAYVTPTQAAAGTALAVAIRGRDVAAVVVPTPFYRRPRGGARA